LLQSAQFIGFSIRFQLKCILLNLQDILYYLRPKMNNPYLIFDFDGTLVDSFSTVIEKFNLMADKFSFRKVEESEVASLRDFSSKELIRFLQIPLYKIPSVIFEARRQMRASMQILSSFDGLPEALQLFHDKGFTLGVLTSNSSENVTEWLRRNNMEHLFHFIHVESSYFGKKQVLLKILKSYGIDKSQAYYVGDETRDIEAAKKCGVASVAVTWGFNSEKTLIQCQPDYIVRQPQEMVAILVSQKKPILK